MLLHLLALCLVLLTSAPSLVPARQLNQVFYSPPPTSSGPVANVTIQNEEAQALMALAKALGNHPAFQGFLLDPNNPQTQSLTEAPWTVTGTWGGYPGWERKPCTPGVTWAWVGCNAQQRVVSLDLNGGHMSLVNTSWSRYSGDPLSGAIPWDVLAPLQELNTIDFGSQMIGGSLTGISVLPSLTNLTLMYNLFTGAIPAEVTALTGLQSLSLIENQLSGPLPEALSSLNHLQYLSFGGNLISGPFPAFLQNLKSLTHLDVSSNPLIGKLPDSWSALSALKALIIQQTTVNGTIPPSWSNMKSLAHFSASTCSITATYPAVLTSLTNMQQLFLSSNNLYGPLPSNILTPKLTQLHIDNNYFNGTLPSAANNIDFISTSNCFLGDAQNDRPATKCTSFYTSLYYTAPPPAASTDKTAVIIVAIVVPLVVCLLLAALAIWYLRTRRGSRLSKLFTKGLKQTSREFTLPELKQATQNWCNTIGKGGYGTVFKAELKDGTVVAVKRLDQVSKQGDVEFIREVELLSRVHHRHLVNLVGFCAERGERALVYEYMAMGSLYEHLHGDSAKAFPLSWDSRCKIAIHVALGIEYLHYGADPPLIHRDIKSANILLSDDGYSKVADFGLCKEAPIGAAADGSEQLVPTATAVRGSFGYLDPEYVNTSILSEKSDVYSYGVVLLELISGHKSIHDWQPLAYWAEEYLADREKTPLMVDPALEGNFDLDELYALCDIARTCVQDQSVNRPTIRDVAKALVENLGHGMTSFTGSQQDSASILASSTTDASSMPSTTYTPSSNEASDQFTYQNYSETLHWTPSGSGQVSSATGEELTVSTGTKGDRLPVPVPKRPEAKEEVADKSEKADKKEKSEKKEKEGKEKKGKKGKK